jgi:hypothetical protein
MTDDLTRLNCPDSVADLPPSATLVYILVAMHGPLTTTDLQQWLSPSTVRWAVSRLESAHVVETRPAPDDPNARQVLARDDDL